MTRQMTLDNPAYFVGYAGICLDSPTKMILKDTDYGCLKDFLRFRDSTTALNQQHLNEATLNIANALLFMVCTQASASYQNQCQNHCFYDYFT